MSRLPLIRLSDLDSLATESAELRPKPRLPDRDPLPGLARRLKPWITAGLIANILVGLFGATVVHGQDPESAHVRSWLATNAPSVSRTEPESFWALLTASLMALAMPKRRRTGRTLATALVALPGIFLLFGGAVLFFVLVMYAIPQLVGMAIGAAHDLSGS